MKLKRKIFASALSLSILAGCLSGICYADNESETFIAKEDQDEKQIEITKISDSVQGYSYITENVITDSGKIICIGEKNSRNYIFEIDKSGKLIAEKTLSGITDCTLKNCGNKICLLYREYSAPDIDFDSIDDENISEVTAAFLSASKDLYSAVYDDELNLVSKTNISSSFGISNNQYCCTDGERICYVADRTKLYIADTDGGSNRLVSDINENGYSGYFISDTALADNYAALTISDGYSVIYAAVDIETGEIFTKKALQKYSKIKVCGNVISWFCSNGNSTDTVIFRNGKFSSFKTSGSGGIIDGDGNVFTMTNNNGKYSIYCGKTKIADIDADKFYPTGSENHYFMLCNADSGIITAKCSYFYGYEYHNDVLIIPYGFK